MQRGLPHMLAVLVSTCLLPVNTAWAEPIQHTIHYTWSAAVTPSALHADNPAHGSLTFQPLSGTREVNHGQYHWFEIAKVRSQVDVWQHQIPFADQPLQIQLTVHDTASGASGKVTFDGMIFGTLYPYGIPDWPRYRYAYFHVYASPWAQIVVLGEHRYRVGLELTTLLKYGFDGEVSSLYVSVIPEWVHAPVTPEPSTLVLFGLGGAAVAIARLRRGCPSARAHARR